MKLKTCLIPEADLRDLEELVRQGYFPNISEAIRHGVKDLIRYYKEQDKK